MPQEMYACSFKFFCAAVAVVGFLKVHSREVKIERIEDGQGARATEV
jgi:hypothetical protein